MSVVTKLLVGLSFLAIVDVAIPLPIVAFVLIYVVLQKPDWFPELVGKVYGDDEKSQ